jgi:cytochrome c peroxidase
VSPGLPRASWRTAATLSVAAVAVLVGVEATARSGDGHAVVAAIAHDPVPDDLAASRREVAALIAHAARLGAKVIVAPELTALGELRPGSPATAGERIPGPATEFFGAQARQHAVWLSISLLERSDSDERFVTAVLLGPDGGIRRHSRKVLVRQESDAGAIPGSFRAVVDSIDAGGTRIGLASVDDINVAVPRLTQRGARVVLLNADAGAEPAASARRLQELAAATRSVLVVSGPDCDKVPCVVNAYGAVATRHRRAEGSVHVASVPRMASWVIDSRTGLPSTVPVPSIDTGNEALAELGRRLFTDRKLSSTGTVACVTCHDPARGFTNGRPLGVGVHGRVTKRNVPSLLNVAFKPLLQWDGYASSIENFVKYPFSGPTEMDFHYLDQVVPYVRSRSDYVQVLRDNLRADPIEFEHIAAALAAYHRTLLSGNSPFDRYRYGGESAALPPAAIRGLEAFTGRAGCARCHTIDDEYALFTDFQYHDLGVGYDGGTQRYRDIGLGGISTNDFAGQFLTPSLRNVALTAPYMHDGSVATLEEVLDLYARGQASDAQRPGRPPVPLSADDRRDLIAFLESLTGDQRYDAEGRALPGRATRSASRQIEGRK